MFIPFFTPFQVLFPTEFPLNYSCYIIVPSLVLLLCQFFTFPHICITSLINIYHLLSIWQSNAICSNNFSSLPDKYSALLYSKLHTTVLAEYLCNLYQGVYLFLTCGKQFQVIHKQQVIESESFVAPFITNLSLSQQPSPWNLTQNRQ